MQTVSDATQFIFDLNYFYCQLTFKIKAQEVHVRDLPNAVGTIVVIRYISQGDNAIVR